MGAVRREAAIFSFVWETPLWDDVADVLMPGERTFNLSHKEAAVLCYFLAASLEADDHA